MTPTKIKGILRREKITQESIAAEMRVHPMTVSKVINKIIVSDRIMKSIAKKIRRDHREVFPEYYLKPPKRSTSKVDPKAA